MPTFSIFIWAKISYLFIPQCLVGISHPRMFLTQLQSHQIYLTRTRETHENEVRTSYIKMAQFFSPWKVKWNFLGNDDSSRLYGMPPVPKIGDSSPSSNVFGSAKRSSNEANTKSGPTSNIFTAAINNAGATSNIFSKVAPSSAAPKNPNQTCSSLWSHRQRIHFKNLLPRICFNLI